jgi:hypothetical protein
MGQEKGRMLELLGWKPKGKTSTEDLRNSEYGRIQFHFTSWLIRYSPGFLLNSKRLQQIASTLLTVYQEIFRKATADEALKST